MSTRGCTCADPYRLGSRHKCTPGRPLCRRTDNKRNRTCGCAGYHFPHRVGSALCIHNQSSGERLNAVLYGDEAVPF